MVVYASDGVGRRVQTATVDGVVARGASVASQSADILAPLIQGLVDAPKLQLLQPFWVVAHADRAVGKIEVRHCAHR